MGLQLSPSWGDSGDPGGALGLRHDSNLKSTRSSPQIFRSSSCLPSLHQIHPSPRDFLQFREFDGGSAATRGRCGPDAANPPVVCLSGALPGSLRQGLFLAFSGSEPGRPASSACGRLGCCFASAASLAIGRLF
jgi:hypothetical protein